MSDKATSPECWRAADGKGFYLRLPGEQRAGKPLPSFDDAVKATIAAGVALPFSFVLRDPLEVPREHMPINRNREGAK